MRKDFFVDIETEKILLDLLPKIIISRYPDLNPENTAVLMVSPDYSASAAMHVAHGLSKDGEMCAVLPIHVPYPDEKDIEPWLIKAKKDIDIFHEFCEGHFENYVLVESGVIRGGTYTWLVNLLKDNVSGRIITTTFFENIHSRFKSNIVLRYYDDTIHDLTFYYEKENKHWK
jgi:hypothetical protein